MEHEKEEITRSNLITTKLVAIYNLELKFIKAKKSYKGHPRHNQTTQRLFQAVVTVSKSC